MTVLQNQEWRYATKLFDPSKKISDIDLATIKEVLRLSASSYGLQLYKILIIQNQELREELKRFSWDQSQITDASHLIVFCNYTTVTDQDIDQYIALKEVMTQASKNDLVQYGDFIKSKIKEKSKSEIAHWTALQTYITLGNLLNVCAELRIDACPIEGFVSEKYNEILKLREKGVSTAVIATIGYRSDHDQTQFIPKTRKPMDKLFETL
ncbi:NAD(P)H-dependent oxidoreductase [Aquimarina sp. I32.4]|uniref:NAD(P)H-dependent oxidoreductase n=1 Tax=Aquimarina sp. I32.4 TaxID=2053903 RepID=UPI000CDF0C48|nr:NAD(P)H-dependent oxidoreductase [Aquimarina sp. I32.4]